jgi:uncharacterized damage-inducible protein DinB
MTDRQMLAKMWDEMWGAYTWIPGWEPSFADLSPQQAAWRPGPGRNSIWQHLNHVCFWRETTLRRLKGDAPKDDEIARRNFEEPTEVSDAAWLAARERLKRAHESIRAAITDDNVPVDKVQYLLPHDAYHLGQVMLLRALQGLPAIRY